VTLDPLPYRVFYRTGGTQNFYWRASVRVTAAVAMTIQDAVKRQGYEAFIDAHDAPIPITYEAI